MAMCYTGVYSFTSTLSTYNYYTGRIIIVTIIYSDSGFIVAHDSVLRGKGREKRMDGQEREEGGRERKSKREGRERKEHKVGLHRAAVLSGCACVHIIKSVCASRGRRICCYSA